MSDLERFMSKVTPEPNSGCWLWAAGVVALTGYGAFWLRGETMGAHRASALLHGMDPGELHVCHRCDNRACVNPAHLFVGTHSDNMLDMYRKKRGISRDGERHHNHRLTGADVDEIRSLTKQGLKQGEIARRFGVANCTVSDVQTGRTWSHRKAG